MHQRLDDEQIGALHGVPPWRVRQRIRELGVHRPPVDPPLPWRPSAPPVDELRVLYTEQGHTLAQIGRMFHTSAPVVREWLDQAGIPVKPRTTQGNAGGPAVLARMECATTLLDIISIIGR